MIFRNVTELMLALKSVPQARLVLIPTKAAAAAKIAASVHSALEAYLAACMPLARPAKCGDNCMQAELSNIMKHLTVSTYGLAKEPFTFSATNREGLSNTGIYQVKSGSTGIPKLAIMVSV